MLLSTHRQLHCLSVRGGTAAKLGFSSSALVLAADDVGDERVADGGRGISDGESNRSATLSSKAANGADAGSGAFEGDNNAAPRSRAADSGSGICEGERSDLFTCGAVSGCGDVSFHGSSVHSQCRLLRFPRNSKVGLNRFCNLFASAMQSLMAAAWI